MKCPEIWNLKLRDIFQVGRLKMDHKADLTNKEKFLITSELEKCKTMMEIQNIIDRCYKTVEKFIEYPGQY